MKKPAEQPLSGYLVQLREDMKGPGKGPEGTQESNPLGTIRFNAPVTIGTSVLL